MHTCMHEQKPKMKFLITNLDFSDFVSMNVIIITIVVVIVIFSFVLWFVCFLLGHL